MRVTGAALLVLLAVTASPAAADTKKEHLQLMAEIRMLQEQQQQLMGVLGALQDTLKAFGTKLDDQSAATRKAMADQTLATTNIGDNVRILREKTDETNVRISTMSQELEALRQTIASQPAPQPVAAAPVDPTAAPTGAAPVSPPPAPAAAVPPGMTPSRMFMTSYDDYQAGRYELAVQGFEGFLQAFPRVPQASGAQYNIGMSYYNLGAQEPRPDLQLKRYAEARDAFLKVVNNYPQAAEVAEGYYKLGQCYEKLNQIDNAKKAWETAVQKFPGNPSALAAQALSRLTRPKN